MSAKYVVTVERKKQIQPPPPRAESQFETAESTELEWSTAKVFDRVPVVGEWVRFGDERLEVSEVEWNPHTGRPTITFEPVADHNGLAIEGLRSMGFSPAGEPREIHI